MKKIVFAVCFNILGICLFAETINLEQVRTLALLNSPSLQRSNLAVSNSLLNERNHLFSMFPSISARIDASVSYLDRDWEFVNPQDTFSSSVGLSITQTIFAGGKNLILRDINAIATESARREALAEFFNVIDSADAAYYAVLEAAATLEAEESALQTALFSLSMAELRLANGMINQGDYLRALADKEVRENSRNQARRNLALSITRLESLIGLTNLPPLEQIDFSKYEELILHLGNITDGQIAALFSNFWMIISAANPSLARTALNIQTAENNLSLAKRDFAPSLSATFSLPSIGYSTSNGFGNPSNAGGFSITGTIPLDFWVMNNRVERNKIAVESATLNYINAETSLEIELYGVLLNIISNAESVLSSRRTLEHVEKHFEFVLERYRLQQSSVSDLQEASTMLINSRNNHTRALYGFLQSLSRLRSLGAIDEEETLINILMRNS